MIFAVHFEFVFAPIAPCIVYLLKYTAILFPLITYATETSGLFLHHFIREFKQFLLHHSNSSIHCSFAKSIL